MLIFDEEQENNDMNIPFYVTRANADGVIGSWGVSPRVAVAVILVVVINFFGWALYGIYELAIKVF